MATEARLVIDRNPPDPNQTGRLTQATLDNKAVAEQVRNRRKQIHEQAKVDASGGSMTPDPVEPEPAPEREPIESVEFITPNGLTIEYGPPNGISLSDRIARLYSTRSLAEGGPDPGLTEYRLTRLLMGVRSVDGKAVVVHNLIDRTKLANQLGDQAIDLLNLYDNRHWPPLRESELPLLKKRYKV